jgi:hypothetical protein
MSGAVYYVNGCVCKHLLPLSIIAFAGFLCGCTQVVTLPVRTVIDLTRPPVRIETDSTIDLVDRAEVTDKVLPAGIPSEQTP